MKINFAIPDNPIFDKLFINKDIIEKQEGIGIVPVPENRCHELLYTNRVDAAFISPVGYGKGIETGDFRVVNGPVLASYGYTGLASVHFRQDASGINKCATPTPDDFMMIAAKLLLAERYNVHPEMVKSDGKPEEMLKHSDAVIVWEKSCNQDLSLDVSEMWADSFNFPMVLGFWACHAEEYPPNIDKIVYNLAGKELPHETDISEEDCPDKDLARTGKLLHLWNDDIEYALDQTIHLLYYHQLVDDIAAIKILGRD